MNTRLTIVMLTSVLLLMVVAFTLNYQTASNLNSRQSATSDTSTAQPAPRQKSDLIPPITYTDQGFSPETMTLKTNTAVRVINNSSSVLEFSSSEHPSHLINPEMNLRRLQPAETAVFTVTKTGVFGYHNHLDASKSGAITVIKQ